jgi:hypothetical protein
MEYFIGSITTLAIMLFFAKTVSLNKDTGKFKNIIINTQSRAHALASDYYVSIAPYFRVPEPLNTQASKHYLSEGTRVVLHENTAYWISDSSLLCAQMINGNIDKENAKRVDTMTLDKVELDKIMFIVDKLTDGVQNDGGNSGNEKLY